MTSHRDIAAALAACELDASSKTVAEVGTELDARDLAAEVDALLKQFGQAVEDASDTIIGMWAVARAIHVATGIQRARILADYFEPFARLVVALEVCAPVATPIPDEVTARLRHLLPAGAHFPMAIPAPAIRPSETDYAAGIRLGIQRARIFERKPITGQRRRRRK